MSNIITHANQGSNLIVESSPKRIFHSATHAFVSSCKNGRLKTIQPAVGCCIENAYARCRLIAKSAGLEGRGLPTALIITAIF